MFAEKLITADEFERLVGQPPYDEGLYELIDGEIVQKMPNQIHGLVQAIIAAALVAYWKRTGKGIPVVEVLHRVPGSPKNARQPDLSYIVEQSEPVGTHGAVSRLPDLAVEIQSPSNSIKQMRAKANFYLANGVKTVWIVYTEARLVEVVTENDVQILTFADTLTGGDLLPDFSLLVSELFVYPNL
jgi:Uma2 family endonuclease